MLIGRFLNRKQRRLRITHPMDNSKFINDIIDEKGLEFTCWYLMKLYGDANKVMSNSAN